MKGFLCNKNIFVVLLLMLFSLTLMAGCSSSKEKSNNISLKEIESRIKKTVNISEMKLGDSKRLEKLYKINSNEIDDFVLYTAPSNLKSDEILIIKAKDKASVDNLKENISNRIKKQSDSFKDYLPDEYYLIQKNVLETKDNYILFVVSKDASKIQDIFNVYFK